MELTYKKLILLFLYSPVSYGEEVNIPIQGRTRFMKMGFLFKEELLKQFQEDKSFSKINLPDYFPWKYGPFSRDFLNDLEFLINREYVNVDTGNGAITEELEEYRFWIDSDGTYEPTEFVQEVFSPTEKGTGKSLQWWSMLTSNQKSLLVDFKRSLNSASLSRILEYVYKKYENDYTNKSLIRDRFLK